MKFLVLGSEGQIGKYLTQYIRQKNHEVIEYDIRRNEHEDLRLFGPDRKLKHHLVRECIKQCDFVFFLAWDVGGSKYLSGAESTFDFIHNNTAIMNSTFHLLKEYDKPFIFTSSQMAAMSHSPYGNTKLIGERYSKALNGIFVRLWNVYGYEKVDERSHVITDFIKMATENNKICMRTNGSETRQFLYVDDCCEALFTLSELYDVIPRSENFHISSYVWTSIEDIAKIVSILCNCEYKKGNIRDSVQMSVQIEPDKNILKYWKPKTSINDGIKHIIEGFNGTIYKK